MGYNLLLIEVTRVINLHKMTFNGIDRRNSSILELSAMMLAVQHYQKENYTTSPVNPVSKGNPNGQFFDPKWGTNGYPRAHSYWKITRSGKEFEIHLNAPVWDGQGGKSGVFVVDVGIIKSKAPLKADPKDKRIFGFRNNNLVTFIEAKSFNIYPMLVAHFIGIVNEIKPWAIKGKSPKGFIMGSHFDPSLVSRGYPKGNTGRLLNSIPKRKLRIRVIHDFDKYVEKGNLASSSAPSVLKRNKKSIWMAQEWK